MSKRTLDKLPLGKRPYNYESSQYNTGINHPDNKDYIVERNAITSEGHMDCAIRNYKCGLI